jgi:hypothetical protein
MLSRKLGQYPLPLLHPHLPMNTKCKKLCSIVVLYYWENKLSYHRQGVPNLLNTANIHDDKDIFCIGWSGAKEHVNNITENNPAAYSAV